MSVEATSVGKGSAVAGTGAFPVAAIPDFDEWGIRAFTTTRDTGTFSTAGDEPVREILGRWQRLREATGAGRLATASQVHEATVIVHDAAWRGWLRSDGADGHCSVVPGTAMAVTVADCVPVFVAHPSGASAVLHSGWRGTVARITEAGIAALGALGFPASELRVHLGPSICGRCYEVSPEVYGRLTGRAVEKPATVDLRLVIADHARAAGVRELSTSPFCTRCDNDRFYSHRAGDAGRQLGVLVTPSSAA